MQCGVEIEVIRNDKIDINGIEGKYNGIIISPGPGVPSNAGVTMQVIEMFYNKLPIFGVCLGLQAIGEFFGATLLRADYPMHGKVSELNFKDNHMMFRDVIKPLKVCRYHSLVINIEKPIDLEIVASTKDGEIMALQHKKYPIWAVQFHPEAILTPQGLKLIRNWVTCFSLQDTKR